MIIEIIGIGGQAGSGKDTAADFLVKEYGFIKMAFADRLKELIHQYYDIPEEELWCNPKSGKVRRILQGTGELIRNINGDQFWIRELESKIVYRALTEGCSRRFVVPDVRYDNEMASIKAMGGKVWRIERKSIDDRDPDINRNHISEQEIDGWDLHISNNRGISEFLTTIKKETSKSIIEQT